MSRKEQPFYLFPNRRHSEIHHFLAVNLNPVDSMKGINRVRTNLLYSMSFESVLFDSVDTFLYNLKELATYLAYTARLKEVFDLMSKDDSFVHHLKSYIEYVGHLRQIKACLIYLERDKIPFIRSLDKPIKATLSKVKGYINNVRHARMHGEHLEALDNIEKSINALNLEGLESVKKYILQLKNDESRSVFLKDFTLFNQFWLYDDCMAFVEFSHKYDSDLFGIIDELYDSLCEASGMSDESRIAFIEIVLDYEEFALKDIALKFVDQLNKSKEEKQQYLERLERMDDPDTECDEEQLNEGPISGVDPGVDEQDQKPLQTTSMQRPPSLTAAGMISVFHENLERLAKRQKMIRDDLPDPDLNLDLNVIKSGPQSS